MEIERFADVFLNINLIIIVFKCNHVKLEIRSFVINFNSRGWGWGVGGSKGTILCGGCWHWAW